MIAAIEAGFPQTEIAAASYRYQREIETGERVIVGVNRFQSDDQPIELLQIDETSGSRQQAKLAALRARRDNGRVRNVLDALKRGAEGTENTMPLLLDAVRAYATLGEICDALRGVFGAWQETPHL
jgi:methylmalonyl-CoA mutase N-terminal domain/subunit